LEGRRKEGREGGREEAKEGGREKQAAEQERHARTAVSHTEERRPENDRALKILPPFFSHSLHFFFFLLFLFFLCLDMMTKIIK